jgi:hypothetical protein
MKFKLVDMIGSIHVSTVSYQLEHGVWVYQTWATTELLEEGMDFDEHSSTEAEAKATHSRAIAWAKR